MNDMTPAKLSKMEDALALCPDVKDVPDLLDVLTKAHEAYLSGAAAGPRDLAAKFPKLPVEVCRRMVESFGWRKQRMERLEDIQVSAAVEYASFMLERRARAAKTIVDGLEPAFNVLAKQIKVLSEPPKEGEDTKYRALDARRLAETMALITDKLMQASGVDGKMPELPESLREVMAEKKGKQPWLNINAAGPVTISKGEKNLGSQGGSPLQETGEET